MQGHYAPCDLAAVWVGTGEMRGAGTLGATGMWEGRWAAAAQ